MPEGAAARVRAGIHGLGNRDAAAGSGVGLLGQTGRLGLASNRAALEERRGKGPETPPRIALPAIEANPQVRRNRPPEHRR